MEALAPDEAGRFRDPRGNKSATPFKSGYSEPISTIVVVIMTCTQRRMFRDTHLFIILIIIGILSVFFGFPLRSLPRLVDGLPFGTVSPGPLSGESDEENLVGSPSAGPGAAFDSIPYNGCGIQRGDSE